MATASVTNIKANIFQEENGAFSMRRLLAFLFALVSFVAGLLCVVYRLDWKAITAAFGIPATACILMLFFTSWTDIAQITENLKK